MLQATVGSFGVPLVHLLWPQSSLMASELHSQVTHSQLSCSHTHLIKEQEEPQQPLGERNRGMSERIYLGWGTPPYTSTQTHKNAHRHKTSPFHTHTYATLMHTHTKYHNTARIYTAHTHRCMHIQHVQLLACIYTLTCSQTCSTNIYTISHTFANVIPIRVPHYTFSKYSHMGV